MMLQDDSMDGDLFDMDSPPRPFTPAPAASKSGEWESFASNFTAEFEALKAEVDLLRTEVKQLKKSKVNSISSFMQAANVITDSLPAPGRIKACTFFCSITSTLHNTYTFSKVLTNHTIMVTHLQIFFYFSLPP